MVGRGASGGTVAWGRPISVGLVAEAHAQVVARVGLGGAMVKARSGLFFCHRERDKRKRGGTFSFFPRWVPHGDVAMLTTQLT